MPRSENQPPPHQDSLIRLARPLMEIGGVLVAVVIWSYNTFALKETAVELKQLFANQRIEMMQYSDSNRARMEEKMSLIMLDIREQLNWLKERIKKGG